MMRSRITIYREGRPRLTEAITIGNTTLTVEGTLVRIARTRHEMFDVVDNPHELLAALRRERLADVFTFTQILPDTAPRFDLPMEWSAISALPITTYDAWFTTQIRTALRKEIRKAGRRGLEIRRVHFNEELVAGIARIFNEVPVRQGRAFWHYGKTIDQVRVEVGQDLEDSQFVGAYFNDELIGFHKLIAGRCFAVPVLCLSSVNHRDKLTDTALIAEAVRFCAERGLHHLLYGDWRRGSHRHFLERHGFEKVLLPTYHAPITTRGALCLRLRAHKGWKGFIKDISPEPLVARLLALRSSWNQKRLGMKTDEPRKAPEEVGSA
jgi:hypothetical protein